jgi:acetylornithine deacetylase
MLAAMARLKADGERPRANVVLVAAVDEEYTFQGALAIVADRLRAEGAMVGEPTTLQPVIAHKGVVRWGVQVLGRAAHTARPDEGINAIAGMLEVLAALRASWERTLVAEHPLLGRATATIVSIEGGVAANVVPDRCRATIDRRTLPGEDPDAVLRACDAELEQLRQAAPAWQVEREEPFVRDYALETDPDDPVVRATVAALLRVTGREARPCGVPYGTDASKLSRLGGIPCVVLGAGDIAQAHTADEYVELDQVAQAAEIYYQTARLFGEGER